MKAATNLARIDRATGKSSISLRFFNLAGHSKAPKKPLRNPIVEQKWHIELFSLLLSRCFAKLKM